MSEIKHRLAVIVASTREGRLGPDIAHWFVQQAAQQDDLEIILVDLHEAGLPDTLVNDELKIPETVKQLGRKLAAADAFVVVTPEYNHGYPAPLKTAIDWFQEEWWAKPVGFVSYGGVSGGLRAVEQLRQIFPEVHALTVRDSVSFQNVWQLFDEKGRLIEPDRHERSTAKMIEQLRWWSAALKAGRAAQAYTA
ncbi:NAD(P)H-dependent oxidoreductase [Alcanivorax sp. JB21]|uniref:NADPH-dependent FMN reductase n=1 Tax=Alcanivorax limicola TaxID=2874102 RepID=UPI001CBE9C6B|nr:NAD(P)H-dependent oxidoreductase [Alcanivorax limicola]MBZ2188834.1 NAD(P)H-dependent oxidoreductase [Alcanivorax limicola]